MKFLFLILFAVLISVLASEKSNNYLTLGTHHLKKEGGRLTLLTEVNVKKKKDVPSNISQSANKTLPAKETIFIAPMPLVSNKSEEIPVKNEVNVTIEKNETKQVFKNKTNSSLFSTVPIIESSKKIVFKENPGESLDSVIYEEPNTHVSPSMEDAPLSIYTEMVKGKPRRKYDYSEKKKDTTGQIISKYSEKYYNSISLWTSKALEKVKERKEILVLSLFCLSIVALKIALLILSVIITNFKKILTRKKSDNSKKESEENPYDQLLDLEKNSDARISKRHKKGLPKSTGRNFEEDNFDHIKSPKSTKSHFEPTISSREMLIPKIHKPYSKRQNKPSSSEFIHENTLTLDIEKFIEEIEKSEFDSETVQKAIEKREELLESLSKPQSNRTNKEGKASNLFKKHLATETILSKIISQEK